MAIIIGTAGDDALVGGPEIDTVLYVNATGSVTVNLELGTSTGFGKDTLLNIENVVGSAFNDVLVGDAKDNVLSGENGNDILIGGNGNDTLRGGAGDDRIDGGAGIDTVQLTDSTGSVTVNLQLGTSTGFGTDTLFNIENVVGSAFNDVLVGDAKENVLSGENGNDILIGGDGNDTLNGGAGDDRIDGGVGIDTAIFNGSLAGYTLKKSGTTYTVQAKAGTDGTDTLIAVESLRFTDKTVNLTIQAKAAAAPQADVIRLAELYVAFFNRVPDADGLSYWIDQKVAGKSINQIADVFYNAGVQFSNLTGFSAGMSNGDFINVIYRNVLGRPEGADAGGMTHWSGLLAEGTATRGSLASAILEAAHGYKGNATYGFVADLLDNKYAVAKTFAIDWGLNYNTPAESISQGMAIALAVTSTSTAAAIALIGVSAGDMVPV